MKYRVFLLVLVCLALAVPAALGDAAIIRGQNGFDDAIDGMCAVGDAVWFAGSQKQTVYRYDASTGALDAFPWDASFLRARRGLTGSGDPVYLGIAAWFAWDAQPCVLAHRYDSGLNAVTDARVYRVDVSSGEASLVEVAAVDWEPLIANDYIQVESACVVDDVLCSVICAGWEFALALTPLDGGATVISDVPAQCVCPYNDRLLVSCADYGAGACTLTTVDAHTGRALERFSLEGVADLAGLARAPGSERVLFVSDGGLMACDPVSGALDRIAGLAMNYDFQDCAAAVLNSGLYAVANRDSLLLRQIDDRPETLELTLAEDGWSACIEAAAQLYTATRPEISVAYTHPEDLGIIDRLLTHTLDADILVLSSTGAGTLPAVLDRGWALPIDSASLREAVSAMYPVFSQRFMPEGQLIAVPVSAFASGMGISVGALECLGLTIDDVPDNWPEFLRFIGSLKGNGEVRVLDGYGAAPPKCGAACCD